MYAVLYLTVEWLKTQNEKDGLVHLYSHQRLLHHMQLGDFDTSLFFMKGSIKFLPQMKRCLHPSQSHTL